MSTDYSQAVADILDALGDSPTPDEAYHATRNYDERYIAAALAASVAAAGGGGGSQPIEYIVTDYTIADVVALGNDIGAMGPVTTLAPGDVLLGATLEITEIWDGTALALQLVADPAGNDLSQAYNAAVTGEFVTGVADGVIDFRTGNPVGSSANSHDLNGWLPSGAPAIPIYATTGVLFADRGATGALTARLIVLRAP